MGNNSTTITESRKYPDCDRCGLPLKTPKTIRQSLHDHCKKEREAEDQAEIEEMALADIKKSKVKNIDAHFAGRTKRGKAVVQYALKL